MASRVPIELGRKGLEALLQAIFEQIGDALAQWIRQKYGIGDGKSMDPRVSEIVAVIAQKVVAALVKVPFTDSIKNAEQFKLIILSLSREIAAKIAGWMTKRIVTGPAKDPYAALPAPNSRDVAELIFAVIKAAFAELSRRMGVPTNLLAEIASEYLPSR